MILEIIDTLKKLTFYFNFTIVLHAALQRNNYLKLLYFSRTMYQYQKKEPS